MEASQVKLKDLNVKSEGPYFKEVYLTHKKLDTFGCRKSLKI